MSRHDGFTSFRKRPSNGGPSAPAGSRAGQRQKLIRMWEASHEREKREAPPGAVGREWTASRRDVPPGASRFVVEENGGVSPRRDPARSRTPAPQRRSSVLPSREVMAWVVVAVMGLGLGVAYLLTLPVPSLPAASNGSAPAPLRGPQAPPAAPARSAPVPSRGPQPSPAVPTRSASSRAGAVQESRTGAPARPAPLPESDPVQVSAPEVVSLLFGDGAQQWTFERVLGESTLRVEVAPEDMGSSVLRASRTLRTPSGRKAWRSLGADHLEVRGGDVAVDLSLTKPAAPPPGPSRRP